MPRTAKFSTAPPSPAQGIGCIHLHPQRTRVQRQSVRKMCHSFPAHIDSFWAYIQLFTRNNSDLEKMRIHMLTATDQHSIPIPGLEQSSTSSGRTMFGHHDDDEDTKDQPLARRGHGTGKLQVTSSFSFRDMAIVSPALLSLLSSRSQVP